MNLFYLAQDPEESVRYLCDKHVVKMTLETAQLLCGVYHMSNQSGPYVPYKLTHKNHPVAVWSRDTKGNFDYLSEYFRCISNEYLFRYNKEHLSFTKCAHLCYSGNLSIPKGSFTVPPKCMPDEYKVSLGNSGVDTVESYRAYYAHKRDTIRPFRYTNRSVPTWLLK